MVAISMNRQQVGDVRIEARGLGAHVDRGLPSDRGATGTDTGVDGALRSIEETTDGPASLAVRAELTVRPSWPVLGQTRGGQPSRDKDEPPRLVLEGPPLQPGEVGQVAVVEENGFVRFVLPVEGTPGTFEIPLGDSLAAAPPEDRGLTSKAVSIGIRVIGVLGGRRIVNAGLRQAVRVIEAKRRPLGLRPFLSGSFRQRANGSEVPFSAGPSALLLIHGFHSSSHTTFRFSTDVMRALEKRYQSRVIAFDHATLGTSPGENAAELAHLLQSYRLEQVDILAHSRGGLVARAFAADPPDGVHIRSILHVATPNAGTPLADGKYLSQFLSAATNVIGLIPDNPVTDVIAISLDVLREWVIEPVGELPGIAAMRPGSEELAELNENELSGVVQRAVASAFEPRSNQGTLMRLRDLVMDQVFRGEDNDLLVPTRSTYARTERFHIPVGRRLVLDTSFGVGHSQFWTETAVTAYLERWLRPGPEVAGEDEVDASLTDPTAELDDALSTGDMRAMRRAIKVLDSEALDVVAKSVGGPVPTTTGAAGPSTKQGTVVVLPGVMGSRLVTTENGREVWFSPWHLVRGRFTDLRLDGERPMAVEVSGMMRQYTPLLTRLDRSWDVVAFPYDWRLPIRHSADALAARLAAAGVDIGGDRPVHFVGHSMGGLVARVFLLDHEEQWARGRGRLVQLGTPNWGSFAMPLAIWGEERLIRALAAADVFHDEMEILDTIASFPGVLELFPSPVRLLPGTTEAEHALLYEESSWQKRTSAAFRTGLRDARTFHESAAGGRVERMIYVAGDNQETPYRVRLDADAQLSFGVTRRGDGRVPHYFGYEGLGPTQEPAGDGSADDAAQPSVFFVDSDHGGLVSDASVLAALDELLETGTTELLRTSSERTRGSGPPEPDVWLKASELERTFAVGDRGNGWSAQDRGARLLRASEIYIGAAGGSARGGSPVKVRIVHGSLEQAKHPVAAGRYKGIPIGGALGYIDERFGGALTELHEAGLYPDDAGTARYLKAPENVYPIGAILLGLGEFGSLTPDLLARAVERGASDYALAAKRQATGHLDLGVSAVLVGTPGRYGLTILTSILATIRGVARASANLSSEVTIHELEIMELSEARALEAAIALERLGQSAELTTMEVPIEIVTTIEPRAGGRPGSHGYEESGAPWPRLMLEFEDDLPEDHNLAEPPTKAVRKLKYVAMGRRAQASNLEVQVVLNQIDRHVRTAIQEPRGDSQVNNTLFELLLPNDAKLELETLDNLHLLVDESTAWIPWEMITGRDTTGEDSRPLALRAGLLRQLKPRATDPPRKALRAVTNDALVIGDPPTGTLPRLPGARDEAKLVADALGGAGFPVNRTCIFEDDAQEGEAVAAMVLDEFFRKHYRVIHIAAHGHFDSETKDPSRNGVVLSADEVLGPVQFRQRLVVPDLVFLNCCHVGRIDDESREPQNRTPYAHLAASLALELLRSGVTAVVVAGWAVNDRQAEAFAGRFYRCMLGGETFGEAVREARSVAHDGGLTNTWAAYQCYGDPDFQLRTDRPPERSHRTIHSPRHLINVLKAVEKQAGDAVDPEHIAAVMQRIEVLQGEAEERFGKDAEVWLALAQAYGEAGDFERAVRAYRDAIEKDSMSERSVRTIDAYRQLANLEARLATQRARNPTAADRGARLVAEGPEELFARAKKRLEDLIPLDQSAEWFAIRGSLFKKWASTLSGDTQKDNLRQSLDAYRSAVRVNNPEESPEVELNVYHASLTLLMAYALEWPDGESIRDTYLERFARQRSSYDPAAGDYWERARIADIDATAIVVDGGLLDARRDDLVAGFVNAFRVRSTARNRASVIDNYVDLSHLLPTPQQCAAAREVANELGTFRPPRLARRNRTT